MGRLTPRVERLEQGDDGYCTLAEIFDALDAKDRGDTPLPLRPLDPRLVELLAGINMLGVPEI